MSFTSSQVTMAFGGNSTQQRSGVDGNSQYMPESISSTTRRKMHAPKRGGHYSIMAIVDAVSAPTSATGLTLWYSNLPNPDITTDTDWVQDTTVDTIIALTATGKTLINVGNVFAQHVMLKADCTAGSLTMRAFWRAEGSEV